MAYCEREVVGTQIRTSFHSGIQSLAWSVELRKRNMLRAYLRAQLCCYSAEQYYRHLTKMWTFYIALHCVNNSSSPRSIIDTTILFQFVDLTWETQVSQDTSVSFWHTVYIIMNWVWIRCLSDFSASQFLHLFKLWSWYLYMTQKRLEDLKNWSVNRFKNCSYEYYIII